MKILKGNDYRILEKLVGLKQNATKKAASSYLKKVYSEVIETKDYIFAEGDIPIALVAHLDTVFEKDKVHKRDKLFYDIEKGIMWNPYGAGFDDKAGVFAILKIIQKGYRPHIIFTTDEELGGIGAMALTDKYENCPFKELKYVIELDRANEVDCVFYDCYNPKFIEYIESFGFIEAWGTFSDIDVICEDWGVAGVNLSIGYKDEHTCSETLNVNAMFKTIEKIEHMLQDVKNVEQFKYIRAPHYNYYYNYYGYYEEPHLITCDKCGQTFYNYETTPVKRLNGETEHFCVDCLVDMNVEWCKICDEAFERQPHSKEKYCNDCKERSWTSEKLKRK